MYFQVYVVESTSSYTMLIVDTFENHSCREVTVMENKKFASAYGDPNRISKYEDLLLKTMKLSVHISFKIYRKQ